MTILYANKIEALLANAPPLGFTESDFAELAIAALDQAGIPADLQSSVRGMVETSRAIAKARRDVADADARSAAMRGRGDQLAAARGGR